MTILHVKLAEVDDKSQHLSLRSFFSPAEKEEEEEEETAERS